MLAVCRPMRCASREKHLIEIAPPAANSCVLHVIETLGRGGAEQLLVTLLPELVRQGVRAEVAVLHGPFDLAPELEARGIPVHVLPVQRKWSLYATAIDLAELATARRADILHAHLYFSVAATALVRQLGLWRGGTAATFHNLAYSGANRHTWKLRMRRYLASKLVRRGIDLPIGVSQAVADHYRTAYDLERMDVVHNPVDSTGLADLVPGDDGTVALPGRLVHEKGHFDLIAALAQLSASPPLLCLGGGKLRDEIAMRAEEAGVLVEITGPLDHRALMQRLAAVRLVVIPSRFEGFGLTALEALALGKPVIASDAGGLPEVLGNAGRIVPRGDVTALAEALMEGLADAGWRAAQVESAKAQVLRFALPKIAARQIALYETIMP